MNTYLITYLYTAQNRTETTTVEAVSKVAATDYAQAAFGTNDMVFVSCQQV